MKLSPIPGTVKRKLGVASHLAALSALGANDVGAPVPFGSGRSHFGSRFQRGGPLAHTLAFEDDADFQSQVLETVTSVEEKVRENSKAYRKLEEDFAAIRRVANDQQANVETFLRTLKQLQQQMSQDKRYFLGNPIERIVQDREMSVRVNIAARYAISKNGDLVSDRLKDEFKEITGKALGEDASPGSLLIDDKLASSIYDTLASFGIWSSFGVDRVGSQTVKYPVTTARPTASFVLTEAGTISDGSFTGTSVSNVMEVIAALINVSLQLVQDAEYDITSYVMNAFGESYSERLDHACLGADGTADATNGGMTGIFSGGTAATADAGAGADDTVEELEFEDWTRPLLTVDPIVLQRKARWWLHPQILVRALSIKDLNGRPIFLTALEAPAAGSIGTILGYPITPSMKAPNTNSASQKVAAFGDPQGLAVGVRSDFVFEGSDHHRWNTLERSFRGWGRAGTKIKRALAFSILTLGA